MLFHMQVAAEHIERATEELLHVGSVQIYGTSTRLLEMIRQLSGWAVPISVKARHIAGFTRLRAP
jgi:hypothetical protein